MPRSFNTHVYVYSPIKLSVEDEMNVE